MKKLESVFQYDIGGDKIEPKQELVSLGALYRCCLCLNSVLELIRAGYVGSAIALLRQVYELLVWAKMAIDNDNTSHLIKIHDDFYNDSKNLKGNVLGSYYSKLRYVSDDGLLDEESIKQEGKFVFKMYSQMIHGGTMAQQYPLPSDEFYKNIENVIWETAMWMECFSGVILSYIHKCLKVENAEYKQQEKFDGLDWSLHKKFMIGNCLIEMVSDQMEKLRKIAPEAERTKIYKVYTKTKWIMKD